MNSVVQLHCILLPHIISYGTLVPLHCASIKCACCSGQRSWNARRLVASHLPPMPCRPCSRLHLQSPSRVWFGEVVEQLGRQVGLGAFRALKPEVHYDTLACSWNICLLCDTLKAVEFPDSAIGPIVQLERRCGISASRGSNALCTLAALTPCLPPFWWGSAAWAGVVVRVVHGLNMLRRKYVTAMSKPSLAGHQGSQSHDSLQWWLHKTWSCFNRRGCDYDVQLFVQTCRVPCLEHTLRHLCSQLPSTSGSPGSADFGLAQSISVKVTGLSGTPGQAEMIDE